MHPVKKSIIDFILGAMITISINLLVEEALGFSIPILRIIFFHLGIWTGIYFILKFPRWVIPPIALGSIFAIGVSNYQGILQIENLWDFVKWAIAFMKGAEVSIISRYDFYLIVLLFTMVDAITGLILLRLRSTVLLSLWSIFFIMEWYRYIDGAIRYLNIFIFGFILFYIYESHQRYIEKVAENHHVGTGIPFRNIAAYGTLSLMLIIGTANLVSIKFEPISFQRINDTIVRIFPSFAEWRSDGEGKGIHSGFKFEETPYQANKEKLGGAIQEDRRTVMYVSADRQLYLRGRVKSQYTGSNWLPPQGEGIEFHGDDQKQVYSGISYEELKVEVYPTNIQTNTIFAPYKPFLVSVDGYKPFLVSVDGYKVLKTKEDELYIVKSIFKPSPQAYTIYSRIPMIREDAIGFDTRSLGVEMENYLQLPSKLSPKIKELTEKITNTYSTPYEKMKGIEAYLRKTYPYTLTVDTVPDHKDFVEYFLYEERKGYCTYFASAMAVMGRTVGIPTRYVEGFILPSDKNEDGYYEVTADRAHAWVEAYFDGMGWITFEPTPAYNIQRIEVQNSPQRAATINSIASSQERNPNYLAFKNRLDEEFAGLNSTFDSSKNYRPKGVKLSKGRQRIILEIIVFLIVSMLLRIGFCIIRIRKLRLAIENAGAMGYYYEAITSLAKYLQPNEDEVLTPRELLKSVEKYFFADQDISEIIEIIEKGLYSGQNLSRQELKAMQIFERNMEQIVRKRLGIWLFFYHKYIKGNLYRIELRKAFPL
ncbi:hypothetical protein HNQ80_000666 [Anaerosolibacter carboniphilus]|uniref:Transglutaminase-like domain-containing protein n=1 Tax=Anaerosolibacter carboniphilus TaxID=1417629 RepID=A0A841KMF1_9FIRM|nr:transglutaminase domain-containing protein [Anaerosolibacter carboniphilus]MBB6214583.1 hypothetical protein [Anaerosolibacter carboniphilus]